MSHRIQTANATSDADFRQGLLSSQKIAPRGGMSHRIQTANATSDADFRQGLLSSQKIAPRGGKMDVMVRSSGGVIRYEK
ncbi:hypothetical protein TNCT_410861 [Trichonephila clavata]|uniref:Uncharacterized protein n=1 Tax=Trichonephila clavata TaxID=2740835 RepID=A0A8X6LLB3_TRICU|nr:hypothetical protein TNCT_410861 [Trichonephila clavata]